jgi:hypothetical protein
LTARRTRWSTVSARRLVPVMLVLARRTRADSDFRTGRRFIGASFRGLWLAWPRETCHEAVAHRITCGYEDDGHCAARPLSCLSGRRAHSDQDIYPALNEFDRRVVKLLVPSCSSPALDGQIPALHVTQLAESRWERI